MAPRNRIEQDPRLKEAADAAIRRGCTVKQLVKILADVVPDEPISHSGAGRYFKRMRSSMERRLEAQEVRKQWIDEFGKDPEGDLGQLLIALLQTTAYGQLKAMGDQPADLTGEDGVSPKHVALLAGALKDMASANKIDAERIVKIKREMATKAVAEVDKVAKARGLTPEAVAEIRAKILGVAA